MLQHLLKFIIQIVITSVTLKLLMSVGMSNSLSFCPAYLLSEMLLPIYFKLLSTTNAALLMDMIVLDYCHFVMEYIIIVFLTFWY